MTHSEYNERVTQIVRTFKQELVKLEAQSGKETGFIIEVLVHGLVKHIQEVVGPLYEVTAVKRS